MYSLWKKWKTVWLCRQRKIDSTFWTFYFCSSLATWIFTFPFFPFSIKTGQWSRSSNRMALVETRASGLRLFLAWSSFSTSDKDGLPLFVDVDLPALIREFARIILNSLSLSFPSLPVIDTSAVHKPGLYNSSIKKM